VVAGSAPGAANAEREGLSAVIDVGYQAIISAFLERFQVFA